MNVGRLYKMPSNRENVAAKIEQAVHSSNIMTQKNGMEMEQHIYEKSKSKEEYFHFVTRLIYIIQECGYRLDGNLAGPSYADIEQPLVDPLGELQELLARGPCENDIMLWESTNSSTINMPSMRSGSMLSPDGRSEQSEKYQGDYSWRTPAFRKSIIRKFDEAIIKYGHRTSKESLQMEQFLFNKANTREEYTHYVGRVLMYIRETESLMENGHGDFTSVSDISDIIPSECTAFLKRKGRFPFSVHKSRLLHHHFLSRMPSTPLLGGG